MSRFGVARVVAPIFVVIGLLALSAQASANPFTPPGTGTSVADSGFAPQTNGYSFENYTNDDKPTNLTAEEMRKLFGPVVCVQQNPNGQCVLIPQARQWMTAQNAGMSGGHCEGMAVTSEFFYRGLGTPNNPTPFGSNTVPGLPLDGNTGLQRHIAYGFVFQALPAVEQTKVTGTPSQVLEAMAGAINSNIPTAVGFYKSDKTGGHAVTPIAVIDRGNGVFDLVVYDNNFPNQYRSIVVNANNNTWNYLGGTDPSNASQRYTGNANTRTLEFELIGNGLGAQPCFFCGGDSLRRGEVEQPDIELYWEGNSRDGKHGNLEVEQVGDEGPAARAGQQGDEDAGCRMNEDGELKCDNDIEGAELQHLKLGSDEFEGVHLWQRSPQPIYRLPDGDYNVTLTGGQVEGSPNEGFSIVRAGVTYGVDAIELRAGEKQEAKIRRSKLTFLNHDGRGEDAKITFGYQGAPGYEFQLDANDVDEDGEVEVDLNRDDEQLVLSSKGDRGTYSLKVRRLVPGDTQTLEDESLSFDAGTEATISYGEWAEGDPSAPVETD